MLQKKTGKLAKTTTHSSMKRQKRALLRKAMLTSKMADMLCGNAASSKPEKCTVSSLFER